MFAAFAKLLDRSAIQLARLEMLRLTRGSPPVPAPGPIKKDDLFEEAAITTPDVCFTTKNAFHFPSLIETSCPNNNTVHGRLYRCGEDWRDRAAVILVHGWDYELGYRVQFPYLARRLCKLGVNTAMLELPYHCQRRPRGRGVVRDFISNDMECLFQAIQQSIADIRALTHWLCEQGCPKVGLWGISLGAWLGGLVACADDKTSFAVLLTPVGKIDRAVKELAFCEPIREGLECRKISLARLNLAEHHPRLPPEKMLIVESLHDRFAPAETVEEFWHAWGQPEIMRVNHGHISVLISLPVLKRITDWIASKAISETALAVDQGASGDFSLNVATG
jgi:hypothetical protein